MNDGRRFEDSINVHELMSLPQKELMTKIYIQTLKTNGTVAQHCQELITIKDDLKNKADKKEVEVLEDEVKDKIGYRLFKNLSILITVLVSALGVLATVLQFTIGR
jgi:hypothetical protein